MIHKENLERLYDTTIQRIENSNNPQEIESVFNTFISGVCLNIKKFCSDPEWANIIKNLFKNKGNFQVPAINLDYAIEEYEKYLVGMKNFLSSWKYDDDKLNKFLDKDYTFIQSLFDFDNPTNNEIMNRPISDLYRYTNFLVETIEKSKDMLNYLNGTLGDKLIAHSLMTVKYYKIKSIYSMIKCANSIINDSNESDLIDSNDSEDDVNDDYQVF